MTKMNKKSSKAVKAPSTTEVQPAVKPTKATEIKPTIKKGKPEVTIGRWVMSMQIDFSKPKNVVNKKRARA